jgi:Aspartyl protease/PDZ domain
MKTTLTLLLLTAFVALAPSTGVPQEKDTPKKAPKLDAKPVVIPFELLDSRHMALQVKLNGKGPYRVIFDTGAPVNLITNKIAKDSGVFGKDEKPVVSLFGAVPTPKKIKKFQVGDITLENMPTMVMDHPTVAQLADILGPIDGLFGYPFFARYKMTIDYQKKEMTLVPSGFVPGDTMEGMMSKILGAQGKKPEPAVLAPAAVWGFTVDKDKGDDAEGVNITEVLAKSPAAAGGLKVGDRLLTLDGRWTDSVSDTFIAAGSAKPGKRVTLVVQRNGKEVKLTVTPGKGL